MSKNSEELKSEGKRDKDMEIENVTFKIIYLKKCRCKTNELAERLHLSPY